MEIRTFFEKLNENNQQIMDSCPTKSRVYEFLNQLSNFLFPICRETNGPPNKTEIEWFKLRLFLKELLIPLKESLNKTVDEIVEKYFSGLPAVYDKLMLDAKAINEFDPAAYSIGEIILAYPGFHAIMVYRLAHPLYLLGVPVLPRLLSEYAHTNTGIDINPGAKIGKSFFIDHGTGIVIGETTIIGDNVKIYQGVTIGALNVRKEEARKKRHPTIEDNVIIYSGTTILGGNTIIGHDSVIGGNVWLTSSVEPNSIVYNKSETRVKSNRKDLKEPINFII